jgi:DNA helicase HerA-like ATPase
LIIIDEAHRIASRDIKLDDEYLYEVRNTLKDAVRTTRKYGLGWMFISQTLSSLDKEILNQLRIYLFGFGLGWGTELQSLKDIISGNTEDP